MAKINKNYANLKESYLFATIGKKVREYTAANPDKKVIRMGIGDVTKPLSHSVVKALTEASAEMGHANTFKGYGPDEHCYGYPILIDSIVGHYETFGVNLSADEIFISDGAKSDIANITDLFSNDNIILIPDPVYPVYMDSNIMLGRTVKLLPGTQDNGFLPMPDENIKGDIVYLCSPNNPTGAVYTREQLQIWVDFALRHDMIILFDAAYEAFVSDVSLPRSIFEIKGARWCAIEFCSFSKTAGFTGTRCGYTVVPKDLVVEGASLHKMWTRRQTTKFNGVGYVVQKGASAVFSTDGYHEAKEVIAYYMRNASVMADTLRKLNIWFSGGVNSPYIWLKCPDNKTSWEFFDLLLNEAQVVGTPGSGFGSAGEGYFRLTAFNTYENTVEAMGRLKALLTK